MIVANEWMIYRFFKEYPHPDDKQRKELSRELGLEPLQVKFWFQNKRTQMKVTDIITKYHHLLAFTVCVLCCYMC
jgi:hypothetical protein